MNELELIAVGGAVLANKDTLGKLLGPTADYLGGKGKGLVEKCDVNLDGIFKRALRILGPKIDEPGSVNPRVLKDIYDNGRFIEDELTSEYYAGLLASSRTDISRDDRAMVFLKILSQMSTYQIRFHFAYYALLHRKYKGVAANLMNAAVTGKLKIYIPISAFIEMMALNTSVEDVTELSGHILFGLARLGLINSNVVFGPAVLMKRNMDVLGVDNEGMVVCPQPTGCDLFLWSLGYRCSTNTILSSTFDFVDRSGISLLPDSVIHSPFNP